MNTISVLTVWLFPFLAEPLPEYTVPWAPPEPIRQEEIILVGL